MGCEAWERMSVNKDVQIIPVHPNPVQTVSEPTVPVQTVPVQTVPLQTVPCPGAVVQTVLCSGWVEPHLLISGRTLHEVGAVRVHSTERGRRARRRDGGEGGVGAGAGEGQRQAGGDRRACHARAHRGRLAGAYSRSLQSST